MTDLEYIEGLIFAVEEITSQLAKLHKRRKLGAYSSVNSAAENAHRLRGSLLGAKSELKNDPKPMPE